MSLNTVIFLPMSGPYRAPPTARETTQTTALDTAVMHGVTCGHDAGSFAALPTTLLEDFSAHRVEDGVGGAVGSSTQTEDEGDASLGDPASHPALLTTPLAPPAHSADLPMESPTN